MQNRQPYDALVALLRQAVRQPQSPEQEASLNRFLEALFNAVAAIDLTASDIVDVVLVRTRRAAAERLGHQIHSASGCRA